MAQSYPKNKIRVRRHRFVRSDCVNHARKQITLARCEVLRYQNRGKRWVAERADVLGGMGVDGE